MSQYAIVQYYPSIVSGELINVAVVVWDANTTVWRLRKDFEAVKIFAGKDWSDHMLKMLAHWTTVPIIEHIKANNSGSLAVAMSHLKMTPPRGTLGAPDENEVESLASIYLRESHR